MSGIQKKPKTVSAAAANPSRAQAGSLPNCVCQEAISVDPADGRWLNDLKRIRRGCPVLHGLLLHDDIWPRYQERVQELGTVVSAGNPGSHGSVVHTALLRNQLMFLTAPLHHFLCEGERVREEVTRAYRKSLRETWLFQACPMQRHRKFHILWGFVNEILLGWSLFQHGAKIESLAALGGLHDVSLTTTTGTTAIEAKYIGQMDAEFKNVVKSLQGTFETIRGDLPRLYAFLKLRAAEAARQLATAPGLKVACLTISRMGLFTDDLVTCEYATQWDNFVRVDRPDVMTRLISDLRLDAGASPWTPDNVEEALNSLDEVWFCLERDKYGLSNACTVVVPRRG